MPGHRRARRRALGRSSSGRAEAARRTSSCARRLEADELGERAVAVGAPSVDRAQPKRSRSSLRQVDAAVAQVLADVAQDVRQLERDAEVVGESRPRAAVAGAEDAERQAADRAGDAAAVDDEVVERLVARAADVHLARRRSAR